MEWAPKDQNVESVDKPKAGRKKTLDPDAELEEMMKREEEKRQRKEREEKLQ